MKLQRYANNPIVTAGGPEWRKVTTFNPAVIYDDGTFYMLERACAKLDPLQCHVGLLTSTDGYNFELAQDEPVLSPFDFDAPDGTVEDPRVVKIEDTYYMTFVFRKHVSSCFPTGDGLPNYLDRSGIGLDEGNPYRTGIATSQDLRNWDFQGFIPTDSNHDRDNVLFPGKIGGRFAMLRRPEDFVGPKYGCDKPSIWLSYSDDLKEWTDPVLVAQPEADWENKKIGAGTNPQYTDRGWLEVYHGVDMDSNYRVGLMLLDLEDPTKVIGRTKDFIMEPEEYYEKFGLIIPNVVFPSATVVVDDTVFVYYGGCDTCTCVATTTMDEILASI